MRKRLFLLIPALLMFLSVIVPNPASAEPVRSTLYWGVTGSDVRAAQRKLRAWGYYDGAVDGIYGPRMYRAILKFQQYNGLTVDGLVGPETWAALGEVGAPAGGYNRGATRSDDLDLLAHVVSAEAKGEPYEGQVAVAAVLLNRMRDPRFPHTLAGVVYETDAFESVSNGTIYDQPTSTAYKAAQDALNGWDPTGGAVYFWNPATAVSPWVWSRPIITQIGNHVFAR